MWPRAPGVGEDAVLALVAAAETGSEHPLAQAILKRAGGLAIQPVTGFTNIDGRGARGDVDGRMVLLGNRGLMQTQNIGMGGLDGKADQRHF